MSLHQDIQAFTALRRRRAEVERVVADLIDLLDNIDAASADLEPEAGYDLPEGDDERCASDVIDESSLGAPENHDAAPDQAQWAQGNRWTITDAEIDAADLGVTGYEGRDIHDLRADQAIARGLERQVEAIRARKRGRPVATYGELRLVQGLRIVRATVEPCAGGVHA